MVLMGRGGGARGFEDAGRETHTKKIERENRDVTQV